MKTIYLAHFLFFCFALAFSIEHAFADILVKTGIASPQTESDYKNTEGLRQRAMRDAMEQALMEVHGAEITSERGSLDYSQETIRGENGKTKEVSTQQSAFHANTKTRMRGSVKVLKIIREWREGENYLVKLKMEMPPDGELNQAYKVGSIWRQVGRPGVVLDVKTQTNGGLWRVESSFKDYLKAELSRNEVETQLSQKSRYHIKVWQSLDNSFLSEYGTWKSVCELSFSILDKETDRGRVVHREKGGPSAGFSEKEAEMNCVTGVSQTFSLKLMQELAALFNDEWINGRDFKIHIVGLPGKWADRVKQVIGGTLSVNAAETYSFIGSELVVEVTYQGQTLELAESIGLALGEVGMTVIFKEAQGNHINFAWQDLGN